MDFDDNASTIQVTTGINCIDIQGFEYSLRFSRNDARSMSNARYIHHPNIPDSDQYHKCKDVEKVHDFFDFFYNSRSAQPKFRHYVEYVVYFYMVSKTTTKVNL
ncbi:hypothetical protein ACFE04_025734 [Oxalis oulophora]